MVKKMKIHSFKILLLLILTMMLPINPVYAAKVKTKSEYAAIHLALLKGYSDFAKKHGSHIRYKKAFPYKTFSAAYKRLKSGKSISTNCGIPTNWALRDANRVPSNPYYWGANKKTGILCPYYNNLRKVTTLYTKGHGVGYTVKQAVKKGLLKPGDILGFKVHTVTYTGDGYWCYDGGRRANYRKNGFLINYKNNWTDKKIKSVIRWNDTEKKAFDIEKSYSFDVENGLVIRSLSSDYICIANPIPSKPNNDTIKITKAPQKALISGSTYTIKYKLRLPSWLKKINKKIKFTSSDPSVATITQKGKIKAKKSGSTVITLAYKAYPNVKQSLTINVQDKTKKLDSTSSNSTEIKENETISSTVTPTNADNVVVMSDFTIDNIQDNLFSAETFHLKTTVYPENTSNKELEITSDNEDAVMVRNGDLIQGIWPGTANITVRSLDGSGIEKSFQIRVYEKNDPKAPIRIEGMSCDLRHTLEVGQSWTIEPLISPSNASNQTLRYVSSDTSVVTVDETGQVQAVGKGTADVTFHTTDGSRLSLTTHITVK